MDCLLLLAFLLASGRSAGIPGCPSVCVWGCNRVLAVVARHCTHNQATLPASVCTGISAIPGRDWQDVRCIPMPWIPRCGLGGRRRAESEDGCHLHHSMPTEYQELSFLRDTNTLLNCVFILYNVFFISCVWEMYMYWINCAVNMSWGPEES